MQGNWIPAERGQIAREAVCAGRRRATWPRGKCPWWGDCAGERPTAAEMGNRALLKEDIIIMSLALVLTVFFFFFLSNLIFGNLLNFRFYPTTAWELSTFNTVGSHGLESIWLEEPFRSRRHEKIGTMGVWPVPGRNSVLLCVRRILRWTDSQSFTHGRVLTQFYSDYYMWLMNSGFFWCV